MELPDTLDQAEVFLHEMQQALCGGGAAEKREACEKAMWSFIDRIFHEPWNLTPGAYNTLQEIVKAVDPRDGLEHMDMAWLWVSAISDTETARHYEAFLPRYMAHAAREDSVRGAWNGWLHRGIARGHEPCAALMRQWQLMEQLGSRAQAIALDLQKYPFEDREAFLTSQIDHLRLDTHTATALHALPGRRM